MLSRERIVVATLAAVDALGVEHVSLRDVTDRLGVTPPALYDHFQSKDALLRAAADEAYAQLAQRFGCHDGPAAARVAADVRSYIDYARTFPRRYVLLLRYPPPIVSVPGLGPPSEAANAAYETGAATVRAGIGSGELAPDADPVLTPLVSWALAHGIATLVVHGGFDDDTVARLVDHAVSTLLHGLTPRP